jgi:hypothetical protein
MKAKNTKNQFDLSSGGHSRCRPTARPFTWSRQLMFLLLLMIYQMFYLEQRADVLISPHELSDLLPEADS